MLVWEGWLVGGEQVTEDLGCQAHRWTLIAGVFTRVALEMVRTRGTIFLLGDPAWASPERCGAIWGLGI